MRAGEPLDELEPAVESREHEEAGARRTRGEDYEATAGAARASIGHQRHARGGAADELDLSQIEDDQRCVGLGRPQHSIGLLRRRDVETPRKRDLEDAEPQVVDVAAKP